MVSNCLSHKVNNLARISSNLSATNGEIADADFALETINLPKNQILQLASTAMLTHANGAKRNMLSLFSFTLLGLHVPIFRSWIWMVTGLVIAYILRWYSGVSGLWSHYRE